MNKSVIIAIVIAAVAVGMIASTMATNDVYASHGHRGLSCHGHGGHGHGHGHGHGNGNSGGGTGDGNPGGGNG